jgi:hypothetical protein
MRVYGIAAVFSAFLVTASVASPPPYGDADVLALEISDSLLAPGIVVSQISQDLDAIHTAFPGWVDGVDGIQVRPDWFPGVIVVQMTPQAWADYEGGVFEEFNALNAQYGPVTISPIALNYTLQLEFAALYHPVVLASIYAQTAGIIYAGPNSLGGDGSDITSSQVGRYLFKRGWGDCPSGCTYKHFWDFQVTNGNVTLLNEYGDPTLSGVGDTPSPAALLVGNTPNPFDNTTDVAYRVASPTHVQLRVYDASGRRVKDLRDGMVPPGAYTANWDGTDEAGHRVASGVYFCRLLASGVTQTHKMLVIR